MPKDGRTTYDFYERFDYVRAVYFETLRMFPPAQQIPKILANDTLFVFNKTNSHNVELGLESEKARSSDSNNVGPRRTKSDCKPLSSRGEGGCVESVVLPDQQALLVEKGTYLFICPAAVHYNPKYYSDPFEFQPERFMGKFEQTSFIPFSSGTRPCIGRHFSEVEAVCFLAYLIRDFSVHPIPAFEGETREQMKERMFKAIPLITLTPLSTPVMLRKRMSPAS